MINISKLKKADLELLGFQGSVVSMKSYLKKLLKQRNITGRDFANFKQFQRATEQLRQLRIKKSNEKSQEKRYAKNYKTKRKTTRNLNKTKLKNY